jgi:hypothetical protein
MGDRNMISNGVLASYLHCRSKAYFKQAGLAGEVAEIERVQLQLDKTCTSAALDWFLGQHGEVEVLRDPPALATAIHCRARFIVGATAQAGNLCARRWAAGRVVGDKGDFRQQSSPADLRCAWACRYVRGMDTHSLVPARLAPAGPLAPQCQGTTSCWLRPDHGRVGAPCQPGGR